MLKGVIENIVEELPQRTAKTKLLYGIWFIWNHARELFISAVHTRNECTEKKCNSITLKGIRAFQQACVHHLLKNIFIIVQLFLPSYFGN